MKKIFAAFFGLVASAAVALGHDLTLSWNPTTDASVTGYKIVYGPSTQTATNVWRVGLTNITTVTNLISSPTLNYRFTIIATNATAESIPTMEFISIIPPHAVRQPRFVGRTANGFTLTWQASDEADAAAYKVTYGTVSPRTTNTVSVVVPNTSVVITNNVVANALHYFSVGAVIFAGRSLLVIYPPRVRVRFPAVVHDGCSAMVAQRFAARRIRRQSLPALFSTGR